MPVKSGRCVSAESGRCLSDRRASTGTSAKHSFLRWVFLFLERFAWDVPCYKKMGSEGALLEWLEAGSRGRGLNDVCQANQNLSAHPHERVHATLQLQHSPCSSLTNLKGNSACERAHKPSPPQTQRWRGRRPPRRYHHLGAAGCQRSLRGDTGPCTHTYCTLMSTTS